MKSGNGEKKVWKLEIDKEFKAIIRPLFNSKDITLSTEQEDDMLYGEAFRFNMSDDFETGFPYDNEDDGDDFYSGEEGSP